MGYDLHEHGRPQIDDAACIGCAKCVGICPDEVLRLDGGKARASDGAFLGCIACGHCMAICPTGAIRVAGRGMTLDDAVELPPSHHRATADQLEDLLLRRRSIRRFRDEAVSRQTLDRILAMTATAPMGIPPSDVGVIVFHGRDKVRQFSADACQLFGRQAKFFNPLMLALMRPLTGRKGHAMLRDFVRPLLAFLARKHAAGEDCFTYDAPAVLLFYDRAGGDLVDCAIAATYAMLAAESLGLGSCLLGTATAFNHDRNFKTRWGLAQGCKVALAMSLGHPAVEFQRGVARRLGEVRYA